jgi:hypothetical protein
MIIVEGEEVGDIRLGEAPQDQPIGLEKNFHAVLLAARANVPYSDVPGHEGSRSLGFRLKVQQRDIQTAATAPFFMLEGR